MSEYDYRSIAGRELLSLVREAFAFNQSVEIADDSFSEKAQIIFFEDSDTRDASVVRMLGLKFSRILTNHFAEKEDVTIAIYSERSKLLLQCRLVSSVPGEMVVQLPSEGKVANLRKLVRNKIVDDTHIEGLISFEDSKAPCLLRWADVTKDTLGAVILTKIDLEKVSGKITIQTVSATNSLNVRSELEIVRLSPISGNGIRNGYSVAVRPVSDDQSKLSPISRATRYYADLTLNCSVEGSDFLFRLKIKDISVNGFHAFECIPKCAWLSRGIVLKEKSQGLQFAISRLDEDGGFGAQLLADNVDEQMKWMHFVVPLITSGRVVSSASDGKSLITLFFEAGSLIAKGLDLKRHTLTQSQNMAFLTKESDVVFRWVNVSDTGRILGHFSSYRVGLNSWFIGDVAGGQTKDTQLDRDFIKNNMVMLRDLLKQQTVRQQVVGSWSFGGGYWRKFRTHLIESSNLLFLEPHSMIEPEILHPSIKAIQLDQLKLEPLYGEIEEMEDLFSNLDFKAVFKRILSIFDITSCGFFFNALSRVYASAELGGFKRELFKFKYNDDSFLAVFSNLPIGISINGVFDAVYIFPIGNSTFNDPESEKLFYSTVYMNATNRGYKVSAIRSFLPTDLGMKCEMVIFKPEGLGFFEK